MCPPSSIGIGKKFTTARFTLIRPRNIRKVQTFSRATA